MATMISEVYDALRDAQGVSDEKARKAAEAIAAYEGRFSKIENDLAILKWMAGANMTLTLLVLGKLFLLPTH